MKFKLYISLFILGLFGSIMAGIKLVFPLLFGLLLFSYDAYEKGFKIKEIGAMMVHGLGVVKNMVIIFLLIGLITAAWRLSGTIQYLVYYGAGLINPMFFYFFAFILNLIMSMLLGSVNGTATTMGIVLISLARANGSNLLITTGAILSGAMFGDRLSPVSSSINLVADLTGTDVIKNRKEMTKSIIYPTILTGLIYLIISLKSPGGSVDLALLDALKSHSRLNILALIPALMIILLSLFKLKTKTLLVTSSLASILIAYFVQNYSLREISYSLIFGLNQGGLGESLSRIVNGGGIKSMFFTTINVAISAMYYGIFQKTNFLEDIEEIIDRLQDKIGFYWTYVLVSLVFSILFGTQSIVVMLVAALYEDRVGDENLMMLDLENVAILLPALIPWNMAANLALTVYQVSYLAVLFNFFCMLVPITYYFYREKILREKRIHIYDDDHYEIM